MALGWVHRGSRTDAMRTVLFLLWLSSSSLAPPGHRTAAAAPSITSSHIYNQTKRKAMGSLAYFLSSVRPHELGFPPGAPYNEQALSQDSGLLGILHSSQGSWKGRRLPEVPCAKPSQLNPGCRPSTSSQACRGAGEQVSPSRTTHSTHRHTCRASTQKVLSHVCRLNEGLNRWRVVGWGL